MYEAARLLAYAIEQRISAKEDYDNQNDIRACHAAFELAMCGEFALKAYLSLNGIDIPRTHSHSVLMRECGSFGLKIPRYLREQSDILYEYEAATRYDTSCSILDEEFQDAYEALTRFLELLLSTCAKELIDKIKKLLPEDCDKNVPADILLLNHFYLLKENL